jgi:ArsR family transcriptional regulator, virulence genes transcriptional regulator
MSPTRLVERADDVAEILALLGNGKRLAIMCHLAEQELTVGAIAERVSLSQSALSQHLAKLRGLGVVETRRERQMIYYTCSPGAVRELLAALVRIFAPAA